MSSYVLLKTALVLHIAGIALMAGTTLADYLTFRQCWKFLPQDRHKAAAINAATVKFHRLIAVGAALLIISGVTMTGIYRGAFDSQFWFRAKMALVVLIILNGVLIARPNAARIRKLLSAGDGNTGVDMQLQTARKRINIFHLSQLVLFILVFILSAFRFN